ncbi:hypothetical protein BHE74_00034113 [Ensete ventricosum]|nr:hypothetical protein GW17_00024425 [Ensete ventricosum]RWW58980.1 hypothetical protein BHE74_00034113 [Ensete ventricosum]
MQACVRFKLSAVARRGRVIPTTSSFPPFPVQHVIDRGGPSCLAFCKLTSGPLCCPTHGNAHIRPKQDLKVTRSSDRVDFISCHSRPKQDLKVTRSSDQQQRLQEGRRQRVSVEAVVYYRLGREGAVARWS